MNERKVKKLQTKLVAALADIPVAQDEGAINRKEKKILKIIKRLRDHINDPVEHYNFLMLNYTILRQVVADVYSGNSNIERRKTSALKKIKEAMERAGGKVSQELSSASLEERTVRRRTITEMVKDCLTILNMLRDHRYTRIVKMAGWFWLSYYSHINTSETARPNKMSLVDFIKIIIFGDISVICGRRIINLPGITRIIVESFTSYPGFNNSPMSFISSTISSTVRRVWGNYTVPTTRLENLAVEQHDLQQELRVLF